MRLAGKTSAHGQNAKEEKEKEKEGEGEEGKMRKGRQARRVIGERRKRHCCDLVVVNVH